MNKKLLAAFDAFANKDQNAATKLFREFFVESARQINRKMDRQLNEFYEGDKEESLEDEVDAPEEDHDGYDFDDESEGDEFGSEDDFGDEDEFGSDEGVEAGEIPNAEEWAEVKDAFSELEALMQELGADKDEDDFGDEDEFGSDEDEGDTVEFGDDEEDEDEPMQESYQMKAVKVPDMKEQGDVNTKSPVAKGVKGVNGVKGTDMEFKGSTATGTNDKLDSKVPQYKEEDHSNVEGSGKAVYKKAAQKKVKEPQGSVNNQMPLKDIRK